MIISNEMIKEIIKSKILGMTNEEICEIYEISPARLTVILSKNTNALQAMCEYVDNCWKEEC